MLADGTVLEGLGFGATGHAVGEVCFNTAMTGYEEILTDPSYAGQIITFTFPHIGNVGTNEEDIETVNLAATPGARGVILHSAITQPSNYRSTRHLDHWLKSRGIIGLAGIDTRALDGPDPRKRHAQRRDRARAVRAHSISKRSSARRKNGRVCVGMDLVPMVTTGQRFTWDEMPWQWGEGYGRQQDAEFNVVAIDYGIKRNILRQLAGNACKVTVVPATTSADDILALNPDGIFLSNGPGDPAATGDYAVPVIRALIEKKPVFGICLGHQMLGLAVGGQDHENASGPSRRQPSGEGPDHRQGRDHLDKPRFCGRSRDAAGKRRGDPRLAVRRLQLRAGAQGSAGVFGAISPGGLARAARQSFVVRAICRHDARVKKS